jgi:ApaG protein
LNAFFPHAAQTRDVTVRVAVSFLAEQSDPLQSRWFWAYHIRLENSGSQPVQLISRHWKITDGHGVRHDVRGEGVVGEQPIIAPGESYDYVSGCPLQTPTGAMEGSFHMVVADGSSFEAAIPRFPLAGAAVAR